MTNLSVARLLTAMNFCMVCIHANAESMTAPFTTVYDGYKNEGLHLTLDTSLTFDSNVFRLKDGSTPPANTTRSDAITRQSAGFKYDKSIGLHNLSVKASVSQNQFSNFSQLNYDAKDYKIVLVLRIDHNLSSILGASQKQNLIDFSNTQSFSKSVMTTQTRDLSMDYWLLGHWHTLFGVSQGQTNFSNPIIQQQNWLGNSIWAGVSRVSEGRNTITFKTRNIRGIYSNPLPIPLDMSFTQRENELDVNWILSGKSTLTGRLKHISMMYKDYPSRDYAGLAGDINLIWAVSGKVLVNLTGQRNLGQYQSSGSTYFIDDTFSISPVWQVNPKLILIMGFDRVNRDYLGGVAFGPGYGRKDVTQSVMMGAGWSPTSEISLSTSMQYTARNSNLSYQYNDTALNVAAQFLF